MVVASEQLRSGAVGVLELLGSTTDGMVAMAPGGAIVGWNEGAAQLLGYTEAEVLGRTCHEVLGWVDRVGNPVCSPFCTSCRGFGDDTLVATREVIGRSKTGQALWLSVSTVVPPAEVRDSYRLVHLFREVALPPELERLVADRLQPTPEADSADDAAAAALAKLTPREREILGLLAQGADTGEIARRLVISVTTVRNHIQHILGKLGVHSRLEATVLFLLSGAYSDQAPRRT